MIKREGLKKEKRKIREKELRKKRKMVDDNCFAINAG